MEETSINHGKGGNESIKVGDVRFPGQEVIRILFVSHDTGMWGAQRTLLTFLSAIDRSVYVPLLVVPYEGPMNKAAAELGIPVFVEKLIHWVPGYSVSSLWRRFSYLYRFFRTLPARCRALERLIADHDVDLVYTNTVTCIEGAIAAKLMRIPHVWHIHEYILGNTELTALFPYRFYCTIMRLLSGSFIFCSKELAKGYPLLSKKAFVVYDGLPIPPLREKFTARSKMTNGLGVDSDTRLIAVVAALHPRKDHLTFLTAAEQVAKRIKKALFLIVGEGPESYTSLLRDRIQDLRLDSKVRFLGWRDDIPDLMAAVDVLVISSEQESFGLTAIEAFAMETPVVATRCGGPEEIVEDGVSGFLVPVKDPCAMADAVVKLLLDPKFAYGLGINGRKRTMERFGVDQYVQGIQGIIQRTASSKRNR